MQAFSWQLMALALLAALHICSNQLLPGWLIVMGILHCSSAHEDHSGSNHKNSSPHHHRCLLCCFRYTKALDHVHTQHACWLHSSTAVANADLFVWSTWRTNENVLHHRYGLQ